MFLISAEVSGNIMEAARSPIGKEPVKRMKIPAVIKNKFENMKYRHKLTILLVTASLVPMILLVLYSHDRMSSLLREKEIPISEISTITGFNSHSYFSNCFKAVYGCSPTEYSEKNL